MDIEIEFVHELRKSQCTMSSTNDMQMVIKSDFLFVCPSIFGLHIKFELPACRISRKFNGVRRKYQCARSVPVDTLNHLLNELHIFFLNLVHQYTLLTGTDHPAL